MRAIVLGAAAGGGFPQWNSNGPGCRRARAGDPAAPPRTQAGLAVSGDGRACTLLNASPDLRQQIERTPALHPQSGLRSTPIAAVVLTGGEVDAIAGLLTLRERQPFTLFATANVHAVLDANPVFEVLARDVVERRVVALEEEIALPGGLSVRLFAVPGKVPLYLEGGGEPALTEDDQTVGAAVSDGRATLFYVPGCAAMTPALADRLRGAELVLFDGTLWRDDEMVQAGLGEKTGRRMGHMSISGPDGAIAALAPLGIRRRVFVHLNNSNPALLADSPERAEAEAAGWEVAHDGMELALVTPAFARGVRLRFDPVRGGWIVLAPERLFQPDEQAVEILQLVDGARTQDAIVDELAAKYDAPRSLIRADVADMLRDLAEKGVLRPL